MNLPLSLPTRAVFGGRILELSGIIVHPMHQGNGLGTMMLQDFLQEESAEYLATYTRNPAVISMLGNVATRVYPPSREHDLQTIAVAMPDAALHDDVAYHFNRYGSDGLYGDTDPAESLIKDYPALQNPRHALVVAAQRTKEDK